MQKKERCTMSAEQNKTAVRRLVYELFNRTDLTVADEIAAPGYIDHDPLMGEISGLKGLVQFSRSLRSAFPNGHFTINDQFTEGNKVVTRWAFWGTQLGEFAGIPASGEDVWLTAISIHRFVDGIIHESWTGLERVKWGTSEGSAWSMLHKMPSP